MTDALAPLGGVPRSLRARVLLALDAGLREAAQIAGALGISSDFASRLLYELAADGLARTDVLGRGQKQHWTLLTA